MTLACLWMVSHLPPILVQAISLVVLKVILVVALAELVQALPLWIPFFLAVLVLLELLLSYLNFMPLSSSSGYQE